MLSTSSTATECGNINDQASSTSSSRSKGSQVRVEADRKSCWKVKVDDRTYTGCGDAKFYAQRSDSQTEVEKVDDGKDITVTLIVNGETVYREKVRSCGEVVRVKKVESKNGTWTRTHESRGNCEDKDRN